MPSLIPHELSIDVSHLGIGEVLHVRDIRVPQRIQVLAAPDEVVASVSVQGEEVPAAAPSTAEAPTPEAEAEEA